MSIPTSIRSNIAAAIAARLALVTDFKYIGTDQIKLTSGDFAEHEVPGCQIIDLGNPTIHERSRAKRTWNLAVEIVIGDTQSATATQSKLWDIIEYTENTIFAVPNLGIPGVVHMHHLDSYTDMHLMAPKYLGRIEISVEYYQPLVAVC